jgi:hypothetical protein
MSKMKPMSIAVGERTMRKKRISIDASFALLIYQVFQRLHEEQKLTS